MPTSIGSTYINVSVRSEGVVTGMNRASTALQRTQGRFTGFQREMVRFNQTSVGLRRNLNRLGGAFIALAGIGGLGSLATSFVRTGDTMLELQNVLRDVLRDGEDLAAVWTNLSDVAQRTRAPIGDIVRTFADMRAASSSLGLSTQDVIGQVETLSRLFTITGASAQQQSNALRQWNQAIARGTLQAEEFNSIQDSSATALIRVGEAMGLTAGEFRNAVIAQEISARDLVDAVASMEEDVSESFGNIDRTVGQSITQFRNSLDNVILNVYNSSAAFSSFGAVFDRLRAVVESPQFTAALSSAIEGMTNAVQYLINNFQTLITVSKVFLGIWAASAIGRIFGVVRGIAQGLGRLGASLRGTRITSESAGNALRSLGSRMVQFGAATTGVVGALAAFNYQIGQISTRGAVEITEELREAEKELARLLELREGLLAESRTTSVSLLGRPGSENLINIEQLRQADEVIGELRERVQQLTLELRSLRSTPPATGPTNDSLDSTSEKVKLLTLDIGRLTDSTNAYTQELAASNAQVEAEAGVFEGLRMSYQAVTRSIMDSIATLGLSERERQVYQFRTDAMRQAEDALNETQREGARLTKSRDVANRELAQGMKDLSVEELRYTAAVNAYNDAAQTGAGGGILDTLKEEVEERKRLRDERQKNVQSIKDEVASLRERIRLNNIELQTQRENNAALQAETELLSSQLDVRLMEEEQAVEAQRRIEEGQRRLENVFGTARNSFQGFFTDIITGAKSAGDAFRNLGNVILTSVINQLVAAPLATGAVNFLRGAFAGGIGTITPTQYDFAFNTGGNFGPGQVGWVGESGPELLFTGRSRGSVLSSMDSRNILSSGGGATFNINVEAGVNEEQVTRSLVTTVIPLLERRVQGKLEVDSSRDSDYLRRTGLAGAY